VEIYQEWYRRALFKAHHSYDVDALLEKGPLIGQPGCATVNFLRYLDVTISFDNHLDDRAAERLSNRASPADRELSAAKYEFDDLVNQLDVICMVKHNAFTLRIITRIYHIQASYKFEEAPVPLVYDLKDQGVDFTAVVIPAGVSREFTSSYSIPRFEWNEKIKKHSAFVR
jgi:hypothetical protein